MKKFLFHPRTIPIAFFVVCLLAYGLMIPWLGFFWDDWPYTWFAHTLGPLGLVKALTGDRPFLSAIYMTTTTLFGSIPIVWQIFGLLMRWLTIIALWWTFYLVWPRHLRSVTWAALLFAVYPGFLQHWVSVIYSQAYVLLSATLFSLGLMVYTVRKIANPPWKQTRYWLITVLALGLSAFSLFSTEYFFGIELIRPLLLWFVLASDYSRPKQRLVPTLLRWLPYLLLLIVFTIWRGFIFHAETYQVAAVKEFSSGIIDTILGLLQTLTLHSFTGGLVAWAQTFNAPHAFEFDIPSTQYYWLVMSVSWIILMFYLFRLNASRHQDEGETSVTQWSLQAMLVGSAALLVSFLPFWAGGLPFDLAFPLNRFSLAMMPGSALFITGLIEFFIRTRRQKIILLSVLISFAIGYQFQAANTFRRDWVNFQNFAWQLSWRAPAIKPNTALITYQLPFVYYTDNSLSAPLNWIYAPDNHTQVMPYILLYLRSRIPNNLPESLDPNALIDYHFRAMKFDGSLSTSVIFDYAPPGCLHILDPIYANAAANPDIQNVLKRALNLTNLNQIIPNANPPALPPQQLFGKEDRNTWCYYYEKADLARQLGNWEEAARLGTEAQQQHLLPGYAGEWMLFAEAYGHQGDLDQAQKLSQIVVHKKENLKPGVCKMWDRMISTMNPDHATLTKMVEIKTELKCSN